MKITFTAVIAAALAAPAYSFTALNGSSRLSTRLFLDPNALTDYMAKAHEEKLKAVQMAEQKKEAEIQVRLRICSVLPFYISCRETTMNSSHTESFGLIGIEKTN